MKTTYTNTTASAINTMAQADRVEINMESIEIGETRIANGMRSLVGGGCRLSEYAVTRTDDDVRGTRLFTLVCHTEEA